MQRAQLTAHLPTPGLLWGDHPERRVSPRALGERINALLRAGGDRIAAGFGHGNAAFIARVRAAATPLALDKNLLPALRRDLKRDGFTDHTLVRALALVLVAAERSLGVVAYDTQLIAARAVLDDRLAEMATGEGKTLAVALAAATAALAGMPVHVVTANDYLVARDAERLAPLYAALGLRVGTVVQPDTPAVRALAYACDVTYVTAKELVFDYLRDRLAVADADTASGRDTMLAPARSPRLLRGLCMAIIDEADAILIDEARVPLILSQARQDPQALLHAEQTLQLARGLQPGRDFALDRAALGASLTDAGRARLEAAAQTGVGAAWRNRLHREHAVCMALAALHLYQRERHYLVQDPPQNSQQGAKVVLIDDTTGRVAQGRAWSNGLQQLVELKEGLAISAPMVTLAQLTYQRFFPRYHRLGGLSGTLRDSRGELLHTYGLAVRRVPLRRPCRRSVLPSRLFADHTALWHAVAERVAALHRHGRPVLVAADSVAEAEALSQRLAVLGLAHATLHARDDADEARVVAAAGQPGAITVTTNMAGRGTDIELGPGVAACGGLHLICCQLNNARRIDRQLAGRSARQGDPGSVQTCLSLDTALLARSLSTTMRKALRRVAQHLPGWAVDALARSAQRREEQRQRLQRKRLADHDLRQQQQLGFGGAGE